jgi:hypothetical protein
MASFPFSLTPVSNQAYMALTTPFGGGTSTTGPQWSAPNMNMGFGPVASRGFPNQYAQGFPSNNSIMLPFANKVSIDPQERKFDLGMGELMFVRTSEPGLKTLPYPEYQFRNISRLNMHLMTSECRKKYGASKSCDLLLKDWQLFGCQQRDPYDYASGDSGSGIMLEQVSTVIVGQRARMWNIWTASGVDVRPGNHLWIIPSRRKYKSPVEEAMKALSTEGMDDDDDDDDDDDPAAEYFWRMEPYVTLTSANPPRSVYSNKHFLSCPLYVGKVVEMYGNLIEQNQRFYLHALKSVFPDKPNDGYRQHLYALNEVVVFIGVR